MAIAAGVPDVVLTPADIPGADLSELFESHTMPALVCSCFSPEWLWGLENASSKLDGEA